MTLNMKKPWGKAVGNNCLSDRDFVIENLLYCVFMDKGSSGMKCPLQAFLVIYFFVVVLTMHSMILFACVCVCVISVCCSLECLLNPFLILIREACFIWSAKMTFF